jgi:hypothetical protein
MYRLGRSQSLIPIDESNLKPSIERSAEARDMIKILLTSLLVRCTWALGRARRFRRHPSRPIFPDAAATEAAGTATATRRYMLYFMLPLWIAPGFLDYLCHRKTKIETTSGTQESIIHALMMTEAGIPVVMGLLFEINTGVLLMMLLAFFAHWATAFWDVAYASDRREVKPNEQHIHSFLEVLPFCAVSFILCLHWNQFAALFGVGPERPRFSLKGKQPPLSTRYVVGLPFRNYCRHRHSLRRGVVSVLEE